MIHRITNTIYRLKDWRITALLILCLTLGGTSQDIPELKLPIYLFSSFLIGLEIFTFQKSGISKLLSPFVVILTVFILLFAAYLIPLSPDIWSNLDGRANAAEAFELADINKSNLPLSLAPQITKFSLLNFLPVIALVLIFKLSASIKEIRFARMTLMITVCVSIFLGIVQVASNSSLFYLYDFTNDGLAVGFFSNANHLACLVATLLPLAIYLSVYNRRGFYNQKEKFISILFALIAIPAIVFSASSAGYLLTIFIFFPAFYLATSRHGKITLYIGLLLLVLFLLDFFILGNIFQDVMKKLGGSLQTSRREIYKLTYKAIQDFGFFGSGPGSFETVYKFYETPSDVTRVYVSKAHSDFLQLWLEMGVLGLATLFAGLLWFGYIGIKSVCNLSSINHITLVYFLMALVPTLHSLVDYPLRTIGIAVTYVFILLLLEAQFSTKKDILYS